MSLLAALLLAQATPPPAAEFFPLAPGERRFYEVRRDKEAKATLIDEVGGKPASFDGAEAFPIIQKSQFNEVLSTQYYRVEGSTILLVGSQETRTADAKQPDGSIDFTKPRVRRTVLMQLTPAMPVFRYDGKPTTWSYGEVPVLTNIEDSEPIKTDKTLIEGSAKPGATRDVLGRKVDTIEVRAEVQLGEGALAQKIVETSVYGRGVGLIESLRKESGGGSRKAAEIRTTLVRIEKKEGG